MRPVGLALVVLLLAGPAACTSDERGVQAPPTTSAREAGRPGAAGPPPALGPITPDLVPGKEPVQAGEVLRARALPTNQWWTSALTGPFTQNMWARPLVVRAGPEGLAVGAATSLEVGPDVIASPFRPALTLGGALSGVEVTGYGDFSVQLALLRTGGAPLVVDVAQGNPVLSVSVPPGPVQLGIVGHAPHSVEHGADGRLTVRTGGQVWEVAAAGVRWTEDGTTLRSDSSSPRLLSLGIRPDGAAAAWDAAFAAAATRPVGTTSSTMAVDVVAGMVRQHLVWHRPAGAPAVTALLPHQVAVLTTQPARLGTYPSPLGPMVVVRADEVVLAYPFDGLLPGIPALPLDDGQRAQLLSELGADLAATAIEGGSYTGSKALARAATLAEVADAIGADAQRDAALDLLRSGLADWCTYTGADDARWLAHEPMWGGIVAHPSEFGNADYNDHHFHYGYLIRAAATLVELSPTDAPALLTTIDLLVGDVMGGGAELPDLRVFNAYEGHSWASGFAPFADGGDQESSSEAVHAWEAIARWGAATGRADLAEAGLARYVVEAAAARAYWLGELPGVRTEGYAHAVAGIVWGGKVDFATWFDPRASAAIGIQLLPFTFGSLYRHDAAGASARVQAARAADGDALLWPDLFVMEEAIADPAAALRAVDLVPTVEAGSSRSFLRYWVLAMAHLGGHATTVRAASASGRAFEHALVGRNVGPTAVDVVFVDGVGHRVASLRVPPGGTVVQPR